MVFIFLTYFTLYNGLQFHPSHRTDSNVFFLMAEKYFIVCMYHSFLIHLSADGHLGCFHVLAMINSASMNTCLFQILFPQCVCPAVGLLDCMAVLFPVF